MKNMRRILTALLCLCIAAMPLQAFAESSVVNGTDENGLPQTTTTTATTATDENGNTVVTVTVEKVTAGTTADGVQVQRQETRVDTTVTDENGFELGSTWSEEGSETTSKDVELTPDMPLPEVTVTLKPGETAEGTATGSTEKVLEDGTVETTTVDREAQAEAEAKDAQVQVEGTSELSGIVPDYDLTKKDMEDGQILTRWTYQPAKGAVAATAAPEGFDFRYTSFGQMSNFYVGTEVQNTDGTVEEGHSGALQFRLEYNPDYDPTDKNAAPIDPSEMYIAYCADLDTDAKANYWYRLDSLEDAGYYDEETAAHIRAVALNGYWGSTTKTVTDENGQQVEVAATGSLEKMKADMKAALREGRISGITEEEIDSITMGQAINATQSAIWSYANAATGKQQVDADRLAIKGNQKHVPTEGDVKNTNAIYDYLMGLDPIEKDDSMQIIDDTASIKEGSISLTIGDKVSVAEANQDDDDTNDIYEVALNFALVVTPNSDTDDLIVQIIGGVDENGDPIIVGQGRIAGGDAQQDAANGFNSVVYDAATGVYTLKDLQLAENTDFDFDLKLVGSQYLEEGVYIFTSEARGTDSNKNGELDENEKVYSQTFVTVLEGDKEVNVTKGFVLSFNVEETASVSTQRTWSDAGDPINVPTQPDGGDDEPAEEPEGPLYESIRPYSGGYEIPDEEVPLADVPATGDSSWVLLAVAAAAALGIAATFAVRRKQEA